MTGKNPWMKFFPSDWRADPAVQSCSMAARGLWFEMLCLMHGTGGFLTLNGRPMTARQLATLVGATDGDIEIWFSELDEAGVFDRDQRGVVFSRRILRDREKAEKDKDNGKRGGNPRLKGWVNPSDKAQKLEARSQIPDTTAKAVVVAPPHERNEIRSKCIEAAGADYARGFGKIDNLINSGVDFVDRVLPIIRAVAEEARARGAVIKSWAYFAEAIMDEHRAAPAAPAPLVEHVWCEKGSPEFERGNAARVARGEVPWSGFPSRHHNGAVGASFPASDVRAQEAANG